jgi:DUF1016 N-terminal domain
MDWSVYDREFDTIYVNGDNNLPILKTDEDHFKVRLIEETFNKLMFGGVVMEKYIDTVKNIKAQILRSRYLIAQVANRELLYLYFTVGKIISEKVFSEEWGNSTVKKLSNDLQNELKGLRGFSYANIKKMRQFHDAWSPYLTSKEFQSEKSSLPLSLLENESEMSSLSTKQLKSEKGSLLTSQFITHFVSIGFTSHSEIIAKAKQLDERIFYITKSAEELWTVETLKHKLKNSWNGRELERQIENRTFLYM